MDWYWLVKMFGGENQMLPEMQGNRMTANLVTEKTEALGWRTKRAIKDYIGNISLIF